MSIREQIASINEGAKARDAAHISPLALAHMGDCVYDLYVRTLLIDVHDFTAHRLHLAASKRVRASAQAEAARRLLPQLTEREAAVFRRGRNAHMGTVAKNASIADYRQATGLEAVIGYLYLQGEDERLHALMRTALQGAAEDSLG